MQIPEAHREHVLHRVGSSRAIGRQVVALHPAAVANAVLAPRDLDEDAAHSLGRGGEEVAAVLPALHVPRTYQPHVRFVDERGGVESLPRLLVGHVDRGEAAQLVVNERKEVRRGVPIALVDGGEDVGDVGHAQECNGQRGRRHEQPAPIPVTPPPGHDRYCRFA
jgi:hypothetical protein